jgi:hypothetical protein
MRLFRFSFCTATSLRTDEPREMNGGFSFGLQAYITGRSIGDRYHGAPEITINLKFSLSGAAPVARRGDAHLKARCGRRSAHHLGPGPVARPGDADKRSTPEKPLLSIFDAQRFRLAVTQSSRGASMAWRRCDVARQFG